MGLFLQLLTQVQGQQTDTTDLEGAGPPLATLAPDALERKALEGILLPLDGIVPYLPVTLPAAAHFVVEELPALSESLQNGSSNTQFGVNVRQAITSLPGAHMLSLGLLSEPQPPGIVHPHAVIPTTADGVSPASVLMQVGRPQQVGEDGTRVLSIPMTDAFPQTDKLKLAEPPALGHVGVFSQPPIDVSSISSLPPEDPQGFLPPRVPLAALEAVAKQAGHLPHHTILLQLEPPELGHVRVQVRLIDERLAATFWADSPEVRALLHAHLPILHHAVNQQGFQAHQLAITLATDGSVDNTGQFAHQHFAFQHFAQESERKTPDSMRTPSLHKRH
jgi:hypothetical protein